MILIDALEILEKHQSWRRGDDSVQGNPTEIGMALDIVLVAAGKYKGMYAAICQTLDANRNLADGENCTLLALKVALRESGTPWSGDI